MNKMQNDFALFGRDLFGDVIKPKASGIVSEMFTFPPFSILDARSGDWQNRKRAWISLGIKGENGRDAAAIHCPSKRDDGPEGLADANYTSIFDPVLTELAYKWWCPAGGQIVDPFAGGSVRGIVAGALGLQYHGIDLRSEQVLANKAQADQIPVEVAPVWVCGDSMERLSDAPPADMIFSCPPYGDLEKYSDDKADLSNMEWHTFSAAYKRIVMRSVSIMKEDSFACFVVGDFRDKAGFYRNFVGVTVDAFEQCGARLYNEAILSTPVASASMRVTKQFNSGRKLCKTHQNILVFCKGDWRVAAKKCAPFSAGQS